MGKFVIEGGRSLNGEITPQGAKNEALQILCATLLTSQSCHHPQPSPHPGCVMLIQLLRDLGVQVEELGNTAIISGEGCESGLLSYRGICAPIGCTSGFGDDSRTPAGTLWQGCAAQTGRGQNRTKKARYPFSGVSGPGSNL